MRSKKKKKTLSKGKQNEQKCNVRGNCYMVMCIFVFLCQFSLSNHLQELPNQRGSWQNVACEHSADPFRGVRTYHSTSGKTEKLELPCSLPPVARLQNWPSPQLTLYPDIWKHHLKIHVHMKWKKRLVWWKFRRVHCKWTEKRSIIVHRKMTFLI